MQYFGMISKPSHDLYCPGPSLAVPSLLPYRGSAPWSVVLDDWIQEFSPRCKLSAPKVSCSNITAQNTALVPEGRVCARLVCRFPAASRAAEVAEETLPPQAPSRAAQDAPPFRKLCPFCLSLFSHCHAVVPLVTSGPVSIPEPFDLKDNNLCCVILHA